MVQMVTARARMDSGRGKENNPGRYLDRSCVPKVHTGPAEESVCGAEGHKTVPAEIAGAEGTAGVEPKYFVGVVWI